MNLRTGHLDGLALNNGVFGMAPTTSNSFNEAFLSIECECIWTDNLSFTTDSLVLPIDKR